MRRFNRTFRKAGSARGSFVAGDRLPKNASRIADEAAASSVAGGDEADDDESAANRATDEKSIEMGTIDSVDMALIGHGAYHEMAPYWTNAEAKTDTPKEEAEGARKINNLTKLIFSTTEEKLVTAIETLTATIERKL